MFFNLSSQFLIWAFKEENIKMFCSCSKGPRHLLTPSVFIHCCSSGWRSIALASIKPVLFLATDSHSTEPLEVTVFSLLNFYSVFLLSSISLLTLSILFFFHLFHASNCYWKVCKTFVRQFQHQCLLVSADYHSSFKLRFSWFLVCWDSTFYLHFLFY